MKIVDVKLDVVSVPRNTGFICQHGIIRMETDEGITGVGEMSDFSHLPKYSVHAEDLLSTLKQELVGRNPLEITGIMKEMNELFPETLYYYEKGTFIRSGVDMALYDLVGKALGVNVSELLGGRIREKVKVCYPIFRNRTPDEAAKNLQVVADKLEEGFDVFRLYVGVDTDADESFMDGVRTRFGDRATIKSLDFSHLLDWKSALRAARRLIPYGVTLIESPAPRNDFEGLRNFRMAVDLPVSEHVWSFRQMYEMIRHDSVDIFNIALVFIGGFQAARKAAAAAEISGKSCLVGTTQELSLGTAAQGLFAAGLTGLDYISDFTGPKLYVNDIVKKPIEYRDGYMLLPDRHAPGLGMEVDWDKVGRLTIDHFRWDRQAASQLKDRTAGDAPGKDS